MRTKRKGEGGGGGAVKKGRVRAKNEEGKEG